MKEQLISAISPPEFEDEEQSRVARLLNVILWMLIAGIFLTAVFVYPTTLLQEGLTFSTRLFMLIILIIIPAGSLWLRRLLFQGRVELVGWLLSSILFILVTVNVAIFGGIRTIPTTAYILVILLAGLTLGGRATVIFTVTSLIAVSVLYVAETTGLLQSPLRPAEATSEDISIYIVMFIMLGSLIYSAVNNLSDALARAREGEQTVAEANRQLQQFNAELEDLVAARTQALITSAEISRFISTILDKDQLVHEVARQIREAFDYYQVHLYLLDDSAQVLQLAAGDGVAGAELVARQHTVAVEQGLVGQAVRSKEPVLAPLVTQVEDWLPNPLLPDTKAEVAVPIAIGNTVLGVLDIQHNIPEGLGDSDADLLQSISGQVAIALQNAQLLADVQSRAQQEALINEVGQKIQSAVTVEKALQIAVREVGRATKASETRVRLGTGKLILPRNGHNKTLSQEHEEA
ncbi:MAG: GAF domain-containing protein [Chloroflexi bacterium]|nr:GAF domain-containing protein [Chloroflexota bacterium]